MLNTDDRHIIFNMKENLGAFDMISIDEDNLGKGPR